jgi:acetylglutamate kinase
VDKLIAKAEILLEALPYMKRFRGRTVVIKYGGAAMTKDELQSGFAEDVVLLQSLGVKLVIVHGGGPQIGKTLERLGIETRFVRGLRVTDEATMQVVEMVLAGQINKNIVALIQRHGGKAAGLCGKDGNLIMSSKMRGAGGVDLGMVGRIDKVNPELVRNLVDDGFIPVVAPIGTDAKGRSYNINADLAAARVAQALEAEKLILLTDVKGILGADGKLQPFLSIKSAKTQIRKVRSPREWCRKSSARWTRSAEVSARCTSSTAASAMLCCSRSSRAKGWGTEVVEKEPAVKVRKSTNGGVRLKSVKKTGTNSR